MQYDVIVIGSGIAGLFSALSARKAGMRVAVLTKSNPFRSNSAVASGGINGVLYTDHEDSIRQHIEDTIKGADGLIVRRAIEKMCKGAKDVIDDLEALGVNFDKQEDGRIAQRPFGGTAAKRTCYVADRTGAAIVQRLLATCRDEGVEILNGHIFLDITFDNGALSGITVLRRSDTTVMALACKSLILAGGGYAGLYRGHSTNPQESSGDTIAAALRAGLTLSNMEFVQFHPTTLAKSGSLISEAARGEGGYLVDETGERFTQELITRDKLSREIVRHMSKGHTVFLDLRHLGEELITKKLPSTRKMAYNGAGIDITKELLPIAPSAHYTMGGIACDEEGRTVIPGIFACGECAMTGVHGANRLGGNSLLEGGYFGRVAGIYAAQHAKRTEFKTIDYRLVDSQTKTIEAILDGDNRFNLNAMRRNLGETLFKYVGVFRDEEGLTRALEYVHYLMNISGGLHCINKERTDNVELAAILEFRNGLMIAETMILSALERQESRGVHYRDDFPKKNDKKFDDPSRVTPLSDTYVRVSFGALPKESLTSKIARFFHLN